MPEVSALDASLAEAIAARRAANLLRSRSCVQSPQAVELVINDQQWLSFCSNDYLGLAAHPAVAAAMKQGVDRYGVGTGASHLITGHTRAHQQLEEELADFTGREAALLYASGYMANIGTVTALIDRRDHIFADKLNHASLVDAAQLSRARVHRYRHADTEQVRALLRGIDTGRKLFLTDAVFSMDGDIAPLPALAALARQHTAWLMADDAHGFGVLGSSGAGTLQQLALDSNEVPILMATLGKAIGVAGAFVAGSRTLIETLIQGSRTYIYTTAMPPALAEAARAALKIVITQSWRREQLHDRIARFRRLAAELSLPIGDSQTAIQPVMYGDSARALAASRRLAERGIKVPAIRPPTVPEGTARLRISLCAEHTDEHIDRLIEALDSTG